VHERPNIPALVGLTEPPGRLILRISLYFSLISGNLARRLVSDGLGPQPSDKTLILKFYSVFRQVEFGAIWRHFLALIRDPISGGDVLGAISPRRARKSLRLLFVIESCAPKAPVRPLDRIRLLSMCRGSGKGRGMLACYAARRVAKSPAHVSGGAGSQRGFIAGRQVLSLAIPYATRVE
jgi:hypothetical protein